MGQTEVNCYPLNALLRSGQNIWIDCYGDSITQYGDVSMFNGLTRRMIALNIIPEANRMAVYKPPSAFVSFAGSSITLTTYEANTAKPTGFTHCRKGYQSRGWAHTANTSGQDNRSSESTNQPLTSSIWNTARIRTCVSKSTTNSVATKTFIAERESGNFATTNPTETLNDANTEFHVIEQQLPNHIGGNTKVSIYNDSTATNETGLTMLHNGWLLYKATSGGLSGSGIWQGLSTSRSGQRLSDHVASTDYPLAAPTDLRAALVPAALTSAGYKRLCIIHAAVNDAADGAVTASAYGSNLDAFISERASAYDYFWIWHIHQVNTVTADKWRQFGDQGRARAGGNIFWSSIAEAQNYVTPTALLDGPGVHPSTESNADTLIDVMLNQVINAQAPNFRGGRGRGRPLTSVR